MIQFLKKLFAEEEQIKPVYLIGKTESITVWEREALIMSLDFRRTMVKWCDNEIAKNTASLLNLTLTDNELRNSQGYVNWILHVRNFLNSIK